MYKLIVFIKKNLDTQTSNHLKEYTLKHLEELAGEKITIGKVESNILLDEKYQYYIEVSAANKDEMDKRLEGKAGRELIMDLAEMHKFLTFIFIDFNSEVLL